MFFHSLIFTNSSKSWSSFSYCSIWIFSQQISMQVASQGKNWNFLLSSQSMSQNVCGMMTFVITRYFYFSSVAIYIYLSLIDNLHQRHQVFTYKYHRIQVRKRKMWVTFPITQLLRFYYRLISLSVTDLVHTGIWNTLVSDESKLFRFLIFSHIHNITKVKTVKNPLLLICAMWIFFEC